MWYLYADPRIDGDKRLIELFCLSKLRGRIIPVSASAGLSELKNDELRIEICGHNEILNYLNIPS